MAGAQTPGAGPGWPGQAESLLEVMVGQLGPAEVLLGRLAGKMEGLLKAARRPLEQDGGGNVIVFHGGRLPQTRVA